MASHPRDNDKKPRPRQDDSRDGPRKPYVKRVEGSEERGPPKGGKSFGKPGGKPFAKDGKPAPKADEGPKRSERVAKAMARAGIASRREVERLIGLGKVAVNGKILDTPAVLVTRDDVITVDGKPIGSAQATRVWRYNKPAGLMTSHNDPQGRPTVFDALPSGLPRVISVGRLDLNTEGLLLLTNDGELSRALELPTTELVRQYRARARGRVSQLQLDSLKEGVTVDGIRYGPIEATLDKAKESEGNAPANLWISVSITEGKNREVRKVLEHLGLTVNRLIRLAYGPVPAGHPADRLDRGGRSPGDPRTAGRTHPAREPADRQHRLDPGTRARPPNLGPDQQGCVRLRPCPIPRASPAAPAPPGPPLTLPPNGPPVRPRRPAGPRPRRGSSIPRRASPLAPAPRGPRRRLANVPNGSSSRARTSSSTSPAASVASRRRLRTVPSARSSRVRAVRCCSDAAGGPFKPRGGGSRSNPPGGRPGAPRKPR